MNKIATTIREATPHDRRSWDRLVNHPLQSWAWGEFRRSMRVDTIRLVVEQKERPVEGSRPELVEGWQLTFHKIPYTPWTVGYFPKGSMPTKAMLATLETLAKQKNAIFIQFEPNVRKEEIWRFRDLEKNNLQSPGLQISKSLSLRLSHHPLFTKYTFVLDLTKSEDELLAAMHPKTRYNIKVAQKHGVTIKEDGSAAAFQAYLQLTEETTSRQNFYAHNTTYHRNMWQTMHRAGIAKLFTASYQKEIVGAWIVFVWKDTLYYPYGASSRKHKEVMAPNLLLWEIARWGKAHGFKKFDLWGALGPSVSWRTDDPWYGFHRFKEGYRPDLVEFIGSYDLVLKPLLYKLYKILDRVRWFLLKMRY